MNKLIGMIQEQRQTVEQLCIRIENEENYLNEVKGYLPLLNQLIVKIFEAVGNPQIRLDISQDFIVQVLNDIIYGIEQEDTVFLLDVLRYGLLELLDYICVELQGEV